MSLFFVIAQTELNKFFFFSSDHILKLFGTLHRYVKYPFYHEARMFFKNLFRIMIKTFLYS